MVIIISIIMFIECSLPARHCTHCFAGTPHSKSSRQHYYYFYLTETEAQGDFDGVQSIAQKQRAEI